MQRVGSRRSRVLVGLRLVIAVAAGSWFTAAPAWAEERTSESAEPAPPLQEEAAPEPSGPHTANSLQLGLGFRYGAKLSDGDLNPWGTGLGLDVGYTLPNAIYVGANFEYFFGESSEVAGVKISENILQLSAEGGYDVGIGQNFVIRPKFGVGVAHLNASVEGCPSGFDCADSVTKAALVPGVTFLLFTQRLSLALDVRYDLVLTDPSMKALIFSAGIGF